MKLGYVILGIIAAVLIFIFVPGLFDRLVSGVQWILHTLTSIMNGGGMNA